MKRKNYDLMDLFKLIGSILIFSMHIHAFTSIGQNVQFYGLELLARWGVPFYFICSAFLLFEKSGKEFDRKHLIQYMKRILLLYICWFVINFVYIFDTRILKNDITLFSTWFNFFKNTFVSSSFLGSWYLISCLFSSWFIYKLSKRLSTKKIVILTFVIYLICILTSAYSGLLPQKQFLNFKTKLFFPANSFICGSFFFAIGKYIAENKEKISKIKNTNNIIIIIASFFLYYLEIFILKKLNILGATDASFFIIPLSIFISIFCINSDIKIKNAKIFRKISIIIYCSQGTIMLLTRLINEKFHLSNSLIKFGIGTIILTAIVCLILKLQKNNKLKILKYLT